MFESSYPFAFFDYFRVPYAVRPELALGDGAGAPISVHQIRTVGASGAGPRSLLWHGTDAGPSALPASCQLGRYRLRDFTFFGHVAVGAACRGALSRFGHGWHPVEQILNNAGHVQAAVWQDGDGNIFLPFDPAEVMQQFWSERYQQVGRSPRALRGRAALVRGYYLMRPALPRQLQLRLRRSFTRVQDQASFPGWPVEDSLHNLYAWLFGLLARAGWPAGAIRGSMAGGPVVGASADARRGNRCRLPQPRPAAWTRTRTRLPVVMEFRPAALPGRGERGPQAAGGGVRGWSSRSPT